MDLEFLTPDEAMTAIKEEILQDLAESVTEQIQPRESKKLNNNNIYN